MMVIFWLGETKTTVATGVVARLVKVDVHLGMSQRSTTSITSNNSGFGLFWWDPGNQINCMAGVHVPGCRYKTSIAEVVVGVFLK